MPSFFADTFRSPGSLRNVFASFLRVVLTADSESSPGGVSSQLTGGSAQVEAGHLDGAVDERERRLGALDADLDVLGVLQFLPVEGPNDVGGGVAGEVGLKAGLHSLLDSDLTDLLSELGGVFLLWERDSAKKTELQQGELDKTFKYSFMDKKIYALLFCCLPESLF